MKNSLLLHDLLYIEEHRTCNHYMADIGTGFIYREIAAGEKIIQESVQNNHLLFILEGDCILTCNNFIDRKFHSGEMVLIPRMAAFKGQSTSAMKFVDMAFTAPISGCDKLILQNYHPVCENIRYDFQPVDIRYPLTGFLELLIYCLKNGMSCAHFHEIKHREVFFYLRGFYTKEEIATLFFPIIAKSFDFKEFVYRNSMKVTSLRELIELSNMTTRTFQRRFKREFNEPAHDWMLKQICQRIVYELTQPNVSIKDIVSKFNFSSSGNFSRFCKIHFHCTPSQLLKKYRDLSETGGTN